MPASKRRSALDFMPAARPPEDQPDEIVELAPVAEILAENPEYTLEPDMEPAVVGDADLIRQLMAEIQGLKAQVGQVAKSQARIIEETSDLTDNLWFITRPNGKRTQRQAIVRGANGNNQRISIEDVRTAFIGPFDDEATVRVYLAAKALKRFDSVIDWSTCDVMIGREAREIEAREEKTFVKQYGDNPDAAANVLERRVRGMFENEAKASKRQFNLPQGEGRATGPVALPRVMVKKLADGSETLDIRDAG